MCNGCYVCWCRARTTVCNRRPAAKMEQSVSINKLCSAHAHLSVEFLLVQKVHREQGTRSAEIPQQEQDRKVMNDNDPGNRMWIPWVHVTSKVRRLRNKTARRKRRKQQTGRQKQM